MRFSTKLMLWLSVPIVLLLAGYGYMDERRSRHRLIEELGKEGRAITRTVQVSIEEALRDGEIKDVSSIVDAITGFERVYGLRVFDAEGKMFYQSEPLRGQPFRSREALERVLATRQTAETSRMFEGQKVLTYIVPLENPDGSLFGAVQMLQLESFVGAEMRTARNFIIALTVCLILVTGGTAFLVTRYVVGRPIESFMQSIRFIEPGDQGARLPPRGSYELRNLADEFNALLERLEDAHVALVTEQDERRQAETRLKNAERLAALGQLAAGLAHEIGTPLHVIGGRTDGLLRRKLPDETLNKNLRIISSQLDRITRIVREMVEFARVKDVHVASFRAEDTLKDVLEFLDHRLDTAGVRVETSVQNDLPAIAADPDQIYEVLLNLILNAVDAMPDGGRIWISLRTEWREHPDGQDDRTSEFLTIHVEDEGQGIDPSIQERVFDPFFTTKGVGKGSGLGMSVSYGIVREHGGWIDLSSVVGQGTRITVFLPMRSTGAREGRAIS